MRGLEDFEPLAIFADTLGLMGSWWGGRIVWTGKDGEEYGAKVV